jgi:hypothetical protein
MGSWLLRRGKRNVYCYWTNKLLLNEQTFRLRNVYCYSINKGNSISTFENFSYIWVTSPIYVSHVSYTQSLWSGLLRSSTCQEFSNVSALACPHYKRRKDFSEFLPGTAIAILAGYGGQGYLYLYICIHAHSHVCTCIWRYRYVYVWIYKGSGVIHLISLCKHTYTHTRYLKVLLASTVWYVTHATCLMSHNLCHMTHVT